MNEFLYRLDIDAAERDALFEAISAYEMLRVTDPPVEEATADSDQATKAYWNEYASEENPRIVALNKLREKLLDNTWIAELPTVE